MKTIAIIPARMGSSRFPGKPLADLHGVPMVGHVYFRARLNRQLSAVYIATCDGDIARYAAAIGAPCLMTSPFHVRASDRTAEAAAIIEARAGSQPDVVLMIQGDEPMLHPKMIDEALTTLASDPAVQIANLMAPLDAARAADPNEIKVVVNRRSEALYFSRLPVPWHGTASIGVFKQVCVIPFRRPFLATFAALEPTPLEAAESIDMLRALEHGYSVRMAQTAHVTFSVDTPDDLARVSALMEGDPLLHCYRGD